jgi:predicted RNase H-like nuclease (RuvC/YqgF family)
MDIRKDFVIETCCNCGISFALTTELKKQRKSDYKTFHCPNGHPQFYVKEGPGNIEEYKEENKQLKGTIEQLEQQLKELQEKYDAVLELQDVGVR